MKFQLLIKSKMIKNKDFSCCKTIRYCIYLKRQCKMSTIAADCLEEIHVATASSQIPPSSLQDPWPCVQLLSADNFLNNWVHYPLIFFIHFGIANVDWEFNITNKYFGGILFF